MHLCDLTALSVGLMLFFSFLFQSMRAAPPPVFLRLARHAGDHEARLLDVAGAIGLTTTTATLPVNGVYSPAVNKLALVTSGSAALTITTTGSVGIGTTSPQALFHVNGGGVRVDTADNSTNFATDSNIELVLRNQNATPNDFSSLWFNDGTFYEAAITAQYLRNTKGANILFSTLPASGGSYNQMIYTSTGSVGIGTTTPAGMLSINSTTTGTGYGVYATSATTTNGYGVYSAVTGIGNIGYAGYFTNTDTTAVNYGLYASTSSSTGYAGYFQGNVNITGSITCGSGCGSNVLLGTSTGAANPQRSGDATTGLLSLTTTSVSIETGGSVALTVTATGSVGVSLYGPGRRRVQSGATPARRRRVPAKSGRRANGRQNFRNTGGGDVHALDIGDCFGA